MIAKKLIGCMFAGIMAFTAMGAEIVVRVAPPRAIVERRGPPPSRAHIWIDGYHRWDNNAYVWVPGRWEAPPRPRARWVAHHWAKRRGGWVFVEGHWR